jgi:hypothetical protein
MNIHFRGLEVPALGSPRDVMYRKYLIHETKVEAKKHQMMLLMTLGSAEITEKANRSSWDRQAKQVFDEYVMLMFGEEVTPKMKEEAGLLKFYQDKIAKSKPRIKKDSKNGKITVEGLPTF